MTDWRAPSGEGITGSMYSIAAAISMAFRIVPTPGFSFNGIQRNRTAKLMRNVAWPIETPMMRAIPSAKTVQGVFPIPAAMRIASPVPKIHKPMQRIAMVETFGLVSMGSSELHHVDGTSFAGLRIGGMATVPDRRFILEPN